MGAHVTSNVYQRVRLASTGVLKVSGPALNVLMELDGRRTNADISHHLGVQPSEVDQAVAELVQTGAAEPVNKADPTVPQAVFAKIRDILIKAMGPMAEYLLDDCIEEMGESRSDFPVCQLPELAQRLAKEIKRPEASLAFKKQMIELLKYLPR
jgi:hypothetical protein